MGLGIIPQGLCAYITGFYLISCIAYTAVQTYYTYCTQQGVFGKKHFRLDITVFGCVCLCLFHMIKHGNVLLEYCFEQRERR